TATDVAAARFHNTLTEIICAVCLKIRALSRQRRVVLSGGVFQNRRLLEAVYTRLGAEGFDVFMHQAIPTNDGGISLGQIAVAAAIRTS
ncbi:MAG: carbamoyltransferase HypF, partial [Desulfobulbaceae bacterium]|nr:carbamoyltransferase HypF [Desulfobulbaceae bacterium]